MRCTRPIKAGYTLSGSLTFSNKLADQSILGFEFECRKCLPCRLNIAREKAIRAVHEASQHDENIFLTLTYAPEHLKSPELQYIDFQLFMKSLRELHNRGITDPDLKKQRTISYMVTGEYGEKNKRPHWHAIIFNYRPTDQKYFRTSDREEPIYTSETLTKLWGHGSIEYGSVTIDSAGYTARYSAKKLTHGKDHEHCYHPIHKTSSRRALGRSWIEKHYAHTFAHGFIVLPNGAKSKIPRYYVDWAKKHKPEIWLHYVTKIRPEIMALSEQKERENQNYYESEMLNYYDMHRHYPGQKHRRCDRPLTRSKIEQTILEQKFKQLQERLKL